MYLVFEVSNKKIKATLTTSVRNKVVVNNYVAREIPDGIVQNGYILKPEELENHLKVILTEFPKVKNCIFLLNTTELVQRELTTPVAPNQRVKVMVQNQMKAMIGGNKEYSIDYVIRDTIIENDNKLYQLFAYAVPVNLVQNYIKISERIGLKLISIDVHHSAVNKMLKNASFNGNDIKRDASVLIKLGLNHLSLFLIENGQCIYTRAVDFETKEYIEQLQRNNKDMNLFNVNLDPKKASENKDAVEILSPMVNTIIDEIFRIQQFMFSRSHGNPLKSAYIYGPLSSIKGLTEYLNANIDIKVQKVESISTLNIEGNIQLSDVLVSAGAADLKGINLAKAVPGLFADVKVFDFDRKLFVHIPVLGVLLIALIAAVGVYTLKNADWDKKINDIKSVLASDDYLNKVEESKKKSANAIIYSENADYLEAYYSQFKELNLFQKDLVQQIINASPTGVRIMELKYSSQSITLSCLSDAELSGAKYAQNLRANKKLYNVIYSGVRVEVVGEEVDENNKVIKKGQEFYSFELKVDLKEKVPETTAPETTVPETTASETTEPGTQQETTIAETTAGGDQ